MVKCQSCGAENAPGRARCEYCDAALVATRHLDVSWSARSRDGLAGRGRVVVVGAGEDATGERVRSAAEAAFAAAIDQVGAQATADQVTAAMLERLPALLPSGWTIETCLVEALSAPPVGGAQPRPAGSPGSGVGCKVPAALVLMFFTAAFGCCGLAGLLAGSDASGRLARVKGAQVMTAAEAQRATGLVAIEAQVASVDSPLLVRGKPCLQVEATFTPWRKVEVRRGNEVEVRREPGPAKPAELSRVQGIRLGPLPVTFDEHVTRMEPMVALEGADEDELGRTTWKVFPAEKPLTVVGPVHDGVLTADEVSTFATHANLEAHLASEARFGRIMGIVFLVMAGLAMTLTALSLRSRPQAPR